MTPLEDSWTRIGLLLGLLQQAERVINLSLSWVFANQPLALEQIAFFEKSQQKKTLGALLHALRARIDIDTDFDGLLTTFLAERNRFVHRLFTEPGFRINEPKDVPRIREFVDELTQHSMIVLAAFHAFIELWAEEHDLADDQQDPFQAAPALKGMVDHFKRHITRKASPCDSAPKIFGA